MQTCHYGLTSVHAGQSSEKTLILQQTVYNEGKSLGGTSV